MNDELRKRGFSEEEIAQLEAFGRQVASEMQSASFEFNASTQDVADSLANLSTVLADAAETVSSLAAMFEDLPEPTRWQRFCWKFRYFWLEHRWFSEVRKEGFDLWAPTGTSEYGQLLVWRISPTRWARFIAHVRYFCWVETKRDRMILWRES